MGLSYVYKQERVRSIKYDIICKLVDKVIKKYNPCGIKSINHQIRCKRGELCCHGCFYITNNGCNTACMGCKFGFCYYLENDKIAIKVMKLLKPLYILAFLNNFIYIRSSKKEILTQQNLTGDRDIKYRSVFNASMLHYLPSTGGHCKLRVYRKYINSKV